MTALDPRMAQLLKWSEELGNQFFDAAAERGVPQDELPSLVTLFLASMIASCPTEESRAEFLQSVQYALPNLVDAFLPDLAQIPVAGHA